MEMDPDSYGIYPFAEVPLGFGMALAMNESALSGYARLTESQKEEVILRCRDAKSKAEMQRIVDSLRMDGALGFDGSVSTLFEGPEAK